MELRLAGCFPASALRDLFLGSWQENISCSLHFEDLYHMYRKLSKCIAHVGARCCEVFEDAALRVLYEIEAFG